MNAKKAKALRKLAARVGTAQGLVSRELETVVRKRIRYSNVFVLDAHGLPQQRVMDRSTSFNKPGTERSIYRRLKQHAA